MSRVLKGLLALGLIGAVCTGSASAASVRPGDILVVDPDSPPGGDGAVLEINPATGDQSVVSDNDVSGPNLFRGPYDLVLDRFGRLFVVDFDSGGTLKGAVLRVNPASGEQTLLAEDPGWEDPAGLALDPRGRLIMVDDDSEGDSTGAVSRINPASGAVTEISNNAISGPDLFFDPYGVAVERTGRILIADYGAAAIAVDPVTGAQSLISDNTISVPNLFADPAGIGRLGADVIVVDDSSAPAGTGAVLRVDRDGQQSVISNNAVSGPNLFNGPQRYARDFRGRLLVADYNGTDASGALIRVSIATGQQALVSDNTASGPDLFSNPTGVIVVPPKCAGQYATIVGTNSREILKGTRFPDVIAGLGGRDRLLGLRGKDRLCGGKGWDRLIGGKGRDKLRGGPGRDLQRQ